MQSFGEQRQRDYSSDDEESRTCRLCQSQKHVSEGSHKEARDGLSVISHAGWERNRLSGSCEKSVRIALGQQLARPFAHLGADEDELGMKLPRLDVPARGRLALVARRCRELRGSRPPWDAAKPVLEPDRSFERDSTHTNRELSAQGIPHLRD